MHDSPTTRFATAPGLKPGGWSRLTETLRWIGPTLALIVMPKCPMCLVADIALLTGAGVSVAVAETLRAAVIGASLILIVWFVIRKILPSKASSPHRIGVGKRTSDWLTSLQSR